LAVGGPRGSDRHAGRLQVGAGGLAPHARGGFDAPQRPFQPPQREYLLSLLVAQDIGHPGADSCVDTVVNALRALRLAGFQVSITGRFWVSTEGAMNPARRG
jgi:hypothetical protein